MPTGPLSRLAGEQTLLLAWHEQIAGQPSDRTARYAIYIPPALPAPPGKSPQWVLVRELDAAEVEPAAVIGETQVVDSDVGRYREASAAYHDRFAYVFELAGPGRLVRLTITHPDDKVRVTHISATFPHQGAADARRCAQEVFSHGIMSGDEVPLTDEMIEEEYTFFAPMKHLGLIFETGVKDQPAAVGMIRLEEAVNPNSSFGPEAPSPARGARNHRNVGLYWEDPMLGACFGANSTDYLEWGEKLKLLLDYCAWSGQDIITYPTVWYFGPLYASTADPGSWPYGGRLHPAAFPRLMARRCSERGIKFLPTFTIWYTSALMSKQLSAEDVVKGEQDSYNCVTRDGEVITGGAHCTPPRFNGLRPEVQANMQALVQEQIDMCADFDSFAGVSFQLWNSSPLKLGARLNVSYDDWTMTQFAAQIGEQLPGEPGDPERFTQRADWILNDPQRQEQFVEWRCGIMTKFYNEIAALIAASRPGAKLHLMALKPNPRQRDVDWAQRVRYQGIDLQALGNNPNIVISRFTCQTQYRSDKRGGKSIAKVDPRTVPYDPMAVTPEFMEPFMGLPRTGAIIHQMYWEFMNLRSWGKNRAPQLAMPEPWKWEARGGRAGQPYPWGRNFLRWYALHVYLLDPQYLATGGYVLGTPGVEKEVRDFARNYQALPAVPFTELASSGPIVLRFAEAEDKHWWYALNVTDQPANMLLKLEDGPLYDAATGERVADRHAQFRLEVPPFGVRALVGEKYVTLEHRGRPRPAEVPHVSDIPVMVPAE